MRCFYLRSTGSSSDGRAELRENSELVSEKLGALVYHPKRMERTAIEAPAGSAGHCVRIY